MKTPMLKSTAQTKTALIAAGLCVVAMTVVTPRASAALIAYEGFDYPADTQVAYTNNLNGGTGWATPWFDNYGPGATEIANLLAPAFGNNIGLSIISANSLSYTDAVGNVLISTGNKMLSTGTNGNSRPWRIMASPQGANGTTNWISFLGIRLGTNLVRGANFCLYNFTNYNYQYGPNGTFYVTNFDAFYGGTGTVVSADQNGRLDWGKSTGPNDPSSNVWTLIPEGSVSLSRRAAVGFTNLALFVVRIEHRNDGVPTILNWTNDNDIVYAWINPTNLSVEPDISLAFTNILFTNQPSVGYWTNGFQSSASPYYFDFAFDCIAFFAGNQNASGPAAEWYADEIRIGDTWADVIPFTPAVTIQPRITQVQVSGSSIVLTLTGAVSTVYTILGATNLTDPITNILGTATPTDGTGAGGSFTDVNALTSQSQRFYRAKQ